MKFTKTLALRVGIVAAAMLAGNGTGPGPAQPGPLSDRPRILFGRREELGPPPLRRVQQGPVSRRDVRAGAGAAALRVEHQFVALLGRLLRIRAASASTASARSEARPTSARSGSRPRKARSRPATSTSRSTTARPTRSTSRTWRIRRSETSSPSPHGEGDHAKHGGGVDWPVDGRFERGTSRVRANYPSTTLRMVPLPS